MTLERYKDAPTLSGAMAKLKVEGYTEDFNLSGDCLHCGNSQLKISPSDFQIDKYFRFEGTSDPADGAILYAISSDKYKVKGVLVNGYGVYSDSVSNEMLAKLKIH